MTDTGTSMSQAFWAATRGTAEPLPLVTDTKAKESGGGCGCSSPAAEEKPVVVKAVEKEAPAKASSCCGPKTTADATASA